MNEQSEANYMVVIGLGIIIMLAVVAISVCCWCVKKIEKRRDLVRDRVALREDRARNQREIIEEKQARLRFMRGQENNRTSTVSLDRSQLHRQQDDVIRSAPSAPELDLEDLPPSYEDVIKNEKSK